MSPLTASSLSGCTRSLLSCVQQTLCNCSSGFRKHAGAGMQLVPGSPHTPLRHDNRDDDRKPAAHVEPSAQDSQNPQVLQPVLTAPPAGGAAGSCSGCHLMGNLGSSSDSDCLSEVKTKGQAARKASPKQDGNMKSEDKFVLWLRTKYVFAVAKKTRKEKSVLHC